MTYIPPRWHDVGDWMRIVAGVVNPVLQGVANIASKTASYTIEDGDRVVLADATAGVMTITLPLAALHEGRTFTVKKIDASANAVTIDGNGAETIDGALTVALSVQHQARTLLSDGAGWRIIASV